MTFCSIRAIDFRDPRVSSWGAGKVPKQISRPIVKIMAILGDFISDPSLKIMLFPFRHRKYYKKKSRPVNKGTGEIRGHDRILLNSDCVP
jgi:hypothetical protein